MNGRGDSDGRRESAEDRHLGQLAARLKRRFGPAVSIEPLAADASTRTFHRLTRKNGSTAVILTDTSGGPRAFERLLAAHEVLTSSGVPLPRVLSADRVLLSVVFEDLGDLLLADALGSLTPGRAAEVYGHAAEIAASIGVEGTSRVTPGHPLAARPLARERLRIELAFFATHDVAGRRGTEDRELLRRLAAGLDLIADETDRLPRELAHRDFHARNILLRPEGGLGIVDFQDALLAPKYYDLVSLVFDPYAPVGRDLRRTACEAWSVRHGSALDPEEDPGFFWTALQRVLKALGTYAFQITVRANKRFEPAIAPAERTALDLAAGIDERIGTRLQGLLSEIGFGD